VYNNFRTSFTLTNNALNYSQQCSMGDITSASEEKLGGRSWWNCTRFDPLHVNYPPFEIYTSILYGGDQNIVGVNQTWYCDDADASRA